MNLRWVILFAAVAEERSFTRAATKLHIAQPWLSAQLRKLEYELGVTLLERLSAGVELTPEGRELLPWAQQVADASKKFRDLARTMGDVQSKQVRIGSHLPMLDVPALRAINTDFIRRYSQFSLRADSGLTFDLIDQLRIGQLDFVVAISPLPEDQSDLDILPLDTVQPYLLARKGILKDDGSDDLSGREIVAPPASTQPLLFQQIFSQLEDAGAEIRPAPEVDKRAMEHQARKHGSIVLMIEGSAEEFAADTELAATPLAGVSFEHLLVKSATRTLGRAAERYWQRASDGR